MLLTYCALPKRRLRHGLEDEVAREALAHFLECRFARGAVIRVVHPERSHRSNRRHLRSRWQRRCRDPRVSSRNATGAAALLLTQGDRITSGRRDNDYSRLELTVRPYSHLHIVEVAAKGTICNKEVFRRSYDEKIEEVDPEKFIELIDIWALEYAELYIANS